jgi:L-ribulokinase
MAEHETSIERVINGGGIPQSNQVLNQVYANVLGKPVLVPSKSVTSLGSAIFAFMAAGAFKTIEEAQKQVCPDYIVYQPQPDAEKVYHELYKLYRKIYFDFGEPSGTSFGHLLPSLIEIAKKQNA